MPLHISRIKLENFRNFLDFDLALTPTVVIVGENKVGKSNLLHALRLVLDDSLANSNRMLRREDFFDGIQNPLGKSIVITVELSGFEANIGAKAILSKYLVTGKPMTARLTYEFRPKRSLNQKKPNSVQDYEYVLYGGIDEQKRFDHDLRTYLQFSVLPALRDAEGELSNWRRSPLVRLIENSKVSDARLKRISKAVDQVGNRLLRIPSIGALSKAIQNRIVAMVGEMHGIETQLALASSDPGQLLRSVKLLVDGDKSRSIQEASLGTANVLLLCLLLQEVETKISKSQLVSLILAIEEPEAHLHPHLQRVLFRYFLNQQHSIMVTTHSSQIASVSPLFSLVLLRKEEKVGTRPYTARNLALSDWEIHDLERYLDVTLAEIVFAKGVILVEGVSEQFLIPAFASSLRVGNNERLDLDRFGISVCAVYGSDFSPYVKLLSATGLNIPYVVITDGDPEIDDEGKIVFKGVVRALKLLDADDAETLEEHIDAKKWKQAFSLLASRNIFVSNSTVELEVARAYPSKVKTAYSEFSKTKANNNFGQALDSVDWSQPISEKVLDQWKKIIGRIERVGKGRFSQRLANKVNGKKPPQYIQEALKKIVVTLSQ